MANSSRKFCEFDDIQLNASETDSVILARGYTAVCTLVIAFVFFVLALANLARKYVRFHKEPICFCRFLVDYFTNPFLLLAFVSLLPLGAYWIILIRHSDIHARNDLDKGDFCKLPGYLLLWFESSETLALTVFSLYFLFWFIPRQSKKSAMITPREYERVNTMKRVRNHDGSIQSKEEVEYKAKVPKAKASYWCHNTLMLLMYAAIVIICGLYTCPYIVGKSGPSGPGNYKYALDGPWCWIRPRKAQLHFWFYEEWMYMGVSLVVLSISFFVLLSVTQCCTPICKKCRLQMRWDKTIFVPFGIFMFYFFIQFGLMAVEFIIRVCSNSNVPLWYTYAIGKPLSKILLVVAALQMMSTSYRMGDKEEARGGWPNLMTRQGQHDHDESVVRTASRRQRRGDGSGAERRSLLEVDSDSDGSDGQNTNFDP